MSERTAPLVAIALVVGYVVGWFAHRRHQRIVIEQVFTDPRHGGRV